MTSIEKRFVNRKKKADRNIKKIQHAFQYIETEKINTVLELGCGVGLVSASLAETYHFTVYGTDYDKGQIQIAEKLQPKMKHLFFQVENAARLSFEDSRFDLVLSQNVFHHIPNWENAVREIARVLRPGGYFIWLDLTFPEFIKKIFQPYVKNYGLYTIRDIKKAFEANRLNTLFQERLAHGPLSQHHFVLQFD
jgi:ubiquinone/menaquinone biosynthesis C-methylase UbiE